jgi:hypothetical protein
MLSDYQIDLLKVSLGADNFRWETPIFMSFTCKDLGVKVALILCRGDSLYNGNVLVSICHYPTKVIFHQKWVGSHSVLKELERALDVVIFGS